MDFPKSVPGNGLVAGRFIDENPATGQQGSLIPAAWGNAVTDEITNVIKAAEIEPDESTVNQLALAVDAIVKKAVDGVGNSWNNLEDKPPVLDAFTKITTIDSTSTLINSQLGTILIDASDSDIVITLPQADITNIATHVNFIRLDNSINKVTIKVVTGEFIRFHTKRNINGYNFFYLMGAGDYWHIMSNGNKNWYPVSRQDATALGRLSFDASLIVPEGGYVLASGTLLNRTEYPWLWDYAQQSGMLVDEADKNGKEGCFTNGDGTTTFRIPDFRGEFIRTLDLGRGIDIDRKAGSYQQESIKNHDHPVYSTNNETGGIYASPFPASSYKILFKDGDTSETRPRNIAYPAYIKII